MLKRFCSLRRAVPSAGKPTRTCRGRHLRSSFSPFLAKSIVRCRCDIGHPLRRRRWSHSEPPASHQVAFGEGLDAQARRALRKVVAAHGGSVVASREYATHLIVPDPQVCSDACVFVCVGWAPSRAGALSTALQMERGGGSKLESWE